MSILVTPSFLKIESPGEAYRQRVHNIYTSMAIPRELCLLPRITSVARSSIRSSTRPFLPSSPFSSRNFTITHWRMASPQFSEGSDPAQLQSEVHKLSNSARPWQLSPNGRGVERVLKFKTFKAAWVNTSFHVGNHISH